MITFKQYLNEGGNIKIGNVEAKPINISGHGREHITTICLVKERPL